jgi:hypothetical protein
MSEIGIENHQDDHILVAPFIPEINKQIILVSILSTRNVDIHFRIRHVDIVFETQERLQTFSWQYKI